MGTRLALLVVAGSLLALTLAPPAEAKRLRFQVVSVKGKQTATWTGTQDGGCGTIHRSGSQTIAFESLRPARLTLKGFPRIDPRTRKRRGFVYFGIDVVRTNWIFTRTFQQSTPPECPPPPEEPVVVAAQANDCGTKGPFAVPVSVGWRGGFVEFRGILDRGAPGQRAPHYNTCEYEAFHELDLIDSKGRLSQRRLTSRRRGPIRVRVSARLREPGEGGGSQTTTLAATVTLKRIR